MTRVPAQTSRDEQVDAAATVARILEPKRDVLTSAADINVATISSQCADLLFENVDADGHQLWQQHKVLGTGKLCPPSQSVLHDGSPQEDLAAWPVAPVGRLSQMLKSLGGVDTARAVHLWSAVNAMYVRGPASSHKRFVGQPSLAIQ